MLLLNISNNCAIIYTNLPIHRYTNSLWVCQCLPWWLPLNAMKHKNCESRLYVLWLAFVEKKCLRNIYDIYFQFPSGRFHLDVHRLLKHCLSSLWSTKSASEISNTPPFPYPTGPNSSLSFNLCPTRSFSHPSACLQSCQEIYLTKKQA